MGYTHYTYKRENLTADQKSSIKSQVSDVLNYVLLHEPTKLNSRHYDGYKLSVFDGYGEEPICSIPDMFLTEHDIDDPMFGDTIIFNGDQSECLEHETFVLPLGDNVPYNEFAFCKTARKPYDSFVVAVLMIVNAANPNAFKISSDGDREDWAQGRELLKLATGVEYEYPESILMSRRQLIQFNKEQSLKVAMECLASMGEGISNAMRQAQLRKRPLKLSKAIRREIAKMPQGKQRKQAQRQLNLFIKGELLVD